MRPSVPIDTSESSRTLRKAVTTLAIAAQTESLTRTGRMAYNVMIYKAQNTEADGDGGFSAPLSEIIKDFESTTRNSTRVRGYIEQMCTTLVRWFPLSRTDEAQASLDGMEPPLNVDTATDGRVFTLMSEARFTRRSGEQWVTWFFPPTIRDMLIEPSRWAQLDIKEMAQLSHYASLALYEICARYKDVPGGLTNRGEPSFWVQILRPDPETKPREWRKFKNETLKPAIAEINQRTSLEVDMLEERRGRAVVSVQFQVRRREIHRAVDPIDLALVDRASAMNIKERDLDQLIEEHGERRVEQVLDAMERRQRAQPAVAIKQPIAYLRKSLRSAATESLFEGQAEPPAATQEVIRPVPPSSEPAPAADWLNERRQEINEALDGLSQQEIERLAQLARATIAARGLLSPAMQKRFDQKQYRAPMIWEYIRSAYAEERYGLGWKTPPPSAKISPT